MDENPTPTILSKLEEVIAEQKNINRRLDTISKQQQDIEAGINILDKDREILEHTYQIIKEVKELLKFYRENQTAKNREISVDIKEVKKSIDLLPQETENAVVQGLEQVIETVKHTENVTIKDNWWRKFKRQFTN